MKSLLTCIVFSESCQRNEALSFPFAERQIGPKISWWKRALRFENVLGNLFLSADGMMLMNRWSYLNQQKYVCAINLGYNIALNEVCHSNVIIRILHLDIFLSFYLCKIDLHDARVFWLVARWSKWKERTSNDILVDWNGKLWSPSMCDFARFSSFLNAITTDTTGKKHCISCTS